jgi:hypothetical protein
MMIYKFANLELGLLMFVVITGLGVEMLRTFNNNERGQRGVPSSTDQTQAPRRQHM